MLRKIFPVNAHLEDLSAVPPAEHLVGANYHPPHRALSKRIISNVWFICIFATLGGALFGFDVSSMSAILDVESYNAYFGHPSAALQAGIVASMPGGSFIGSIAYAFTGEYLGRKGSIILGCGFWLLGSPLCAGARNVGMLVTGRFFNGVCIGLCSSSVPVYVRGLIALLT